MNGTKEEMHIYLVAWPTKKFNPERSTATTRKRGDAEEQWPRRRSCNVLILRLSWLCTRSGIPSRKRREVAGLSLSCSLPPPLEKHGEESNRRVTHVTYGHVLSSRLSRSFPPRGYSILSVSQPMHLPNERIFLSEINYAENFQDLSSFLVIVESRLIQNYFMADYSIILNIKYICKCRFFNNNDLYFYE